MDCRGKAKTVRSVEQLVCDRALLICVEMREWIEQFATKAIKHL